MCWMHCCFSRFGPISWVLALNISLSWSYLGRNRNLVRLHSLKPPLFESCHIRNGELLHAVTLSVNRCESAKLEAWTMNLSWIRSICIFYWHIYCHILIIVFFFTLYFLLIVWKNMQCLFSRCLQCCCNWMVFWEIWNCIFIKIKATYLRYVCIIFIRIVIYIYV